MLYAISAVFDIFGITNNNLAKGCVWSEIDNYLILHENMSLWGILLLCHNNVKYFVTYVCT